MKTKEMIELLQKADPSGEEEVCVGNVPITDVVKLPAYYDGSLQILERDEKGNIKSGKFVRQGWKINLYTLSLSDALWDYPEMPVDYSQLNEYYANQTRINHDEIRAMVRDVNYKIAVEQFQDWAKSKAEKFGEDGISDIKEVAKKFFDVNLHNKEPLLPFVEGKTYTQLLMEKWDDELEFYRSEDGLQIRKKHGNTDS